jgi:hypothetical protein
MPSSLSKNASSPNAEGRRAKTVLKRPKFLPLIFVHVHERVCKRIAAIGPTNDFMAFCIAFVPMLSWITVLDFDNIAYGHFNLLRLHAKISLLILVGVPL